MKNILIAITFAGVQFLVNIEKAKEVRFLVALVINSVFLTDLAQFSFIDKLINLFQLLFFKGFFLEVQIIYDKYLLFQDDSFSTSYLVNFLIITVIFHFALGNRWGSSKLVKLNHSSRFALTLLDKISQSFTLLKVYHHLFGKESSNTMIFLFTILLAWGQLAALLIGLVEYMTVREAAYKMRTLFIEALILYISAFLYYYAIQEYHEQIKLTVPIDINHLADTGTTTMFIFVYTLLSLTHHDAPKKKVD